MDAWVRVNRLITWEMVNAGLSREKLAQMAEITPHTLHSRLGYVHEWKLTELCQVASVLHIPADQITNAMLGERS